jgi:hypothetical protein
MRIRDEEEESRHDREAGQPLSIEVGDTTPRTNVSSQLATSTAKFQRPEARRTEMWMANAYVQWTSTQCLP